MHRPWDHRDAHASQGGDVRTKGSPLDALFNMISNNDALKAKSGKKCEEFKSCFVLMGSHFLLDVPITRPGRLDIQF